MMKKKPIFKLETLRRTTRQIWMRQMIKLDMRETH